MPIVSGPSLKGTGVCVEVGERLGVNVSVGGNVRPGVSVNAGVKVKAAVRLSVLVLVDVGLIINAFTDGFIYSQIVTKARPAMMLTAHSPTTNRRSFLDEDAGMVSAYPAFRVERRSQSRLLLMAQRGAFLGCPP